MAQQRKEARNLKFEIAPVDGASFTPGSLFFAKIK